MSDTQATNTSQSITDDQDLAQVLAANTSGGGLQFEASPLPGAAPAVAAPPAATADDSSLTAALDEAVQSLPNPVAAPAPVPDIPAAPAATPATEAAKHGTPQTGSPELDDIKRDALQELRPLVDKLDLKAEEKFDTLLLIIRSTDDKTLLAPAHEAAKSIEDDTKRAQALLDIIKEIDYFSSQAA